MQHEEIKFNKDLVLPNFMLVGAMRSGSTYIHRVLSEHPDIFLPPTKELHYFSRKCNSDINSVDLNDYSKFFTEYNGQKLIGEMTPEYIYHAYVPSHLKHFFPDLKILMTLRNPVDRAYSHYWWAVKGGHVEYLSFENAFRQESERLAEFNAKADNKKVDQYAYFDKGMYLKQIQNYLKHFDLSQIHFVLLDDIKQNPQEACDKICEFLGVKSFEVPNQSFKNHATIPKYDSLFRKLSFFRNSEFQMKGRRFITKPIKAIQEAWPRTEKHPPMKPETRQMLSDYFKEANNELFQFLGRPNLWN